LYDIVLPVYTGINDHFTIFNNCGGYLKKMPLKLSKKSHLH